MKKTFEHHNGDAILAEALDAIERLGAARFDRYRATVTSLSIPAALVSIDDGQVLVANRPLMRLLGYDTDALRAFASFADFTHPDDVQADVAQFGALVAGELDGYLFEKRWQRADGRWVAGQLAAVRLNSQGVLGMIFGARVLGRPR